MFIQYFEILIEQILILNCSLKIQALLLLNSILKERIQSNLQLSDRTNNLQYYRKKSLKKSWTVFANAEIAKNDKKLDHGNF